MPHFISKFVACSDINKEASTAGDFTASDEESILNAHLQRQLEEDVASDAYTECNIEHQEQEILSYLNETFNTLSPLLNKVSHPKEDISEVDAFSIPDCTLNLCTEDNFPKAKKGSSPSTELTKEYYALVPINANLLEKELVEQDTLSNAFLSIIKTQVDDTINTQPKKPTSLSLYESTSYNTDIHSKSLSTSPRRASYSKFEESNENLRTKSSQVSKIHHSSALSNTSDLTFRNCEASVEKFLDSTYSPDSLVTDELSSSSDYVSATYTCSPGTSLSSYYHNIHSNDNFSKMDRTNFNNVTDSGIEHTGVLESTNSRLDVTLTDISLSESNLHSCNPEEAGNSLQYAQDLMVEKKECQRSIFLPSASGKNIAEGKELNCSNINKPEDIRGDKATKAEKQRQNEEIVTLESSSLSSETGSWESVFPPKLVERDRHVSKNVTKRNDKHFREEKLQEIKRADSFVVEETEEVKLRRKRNENINEIKARPIPIPSQPVPCSHKYDTRPYNLSEENDTEHSPELQDQIDDFDLNESSSLTIFDMTIDRSKSNEDIVEAAGGFTTTIDSYNKTPNNSILSVRENYSSNYPEDNLNITNPEFNDFIPLTSSSMDVMNTYESHVNHSTYKRDVNNIPIVSGSCKPEIDYNQPEIEVTQSKSTCGSAWIVDMSSNLETSNRINTKNSDDYAPDNSKLLSNIDNNKSRGLVESDVSEKSSHTFFIDLTSLPEPVPSNKTNETARVNEKDNMFTMYIDIGDKSSLKGKPPILQSTHSRKSSSTEPGATNKNVSNKTASPGYSTHNHKKKTSGTKSIIVFEKLESLCNDPNISINEIIKNPESLNNSCVITEIKPETELNRNGKPVEVIVANKTCQTSSLAPVEESVTTDLTKDTGNNNLFVKLSDLDKPVAKPSDFENVKSKANTAVTLYEDKVWDARMTRSIPENNWGDPSFSGNSIISSFHSENALSLNRLFPHLINKFSRSVPASLSIKTRSSIRLETSLNMTEEDKQVSDTSEISSTQSSSVCRSAVENTSTDETTQTSSLAGNCQSRLGQDLLRMFLEEIATDVTVEVNGKRIKAHKCILSSRCQFFAGILSGGYVESAGNVIVLPPFSYNVTHFVMCHIYAGISVIPDSISILELATLTDMLGLEGLKEAIMFTLKAKYCHNFHKPCLVCVAGVVECFPLSSAYGLDDLYVKCLKWITKHYVRVWPTKAFATLPSELLEKCYHQQTVNFTTESLVDSVYGYGIVIGFLQTYRWGELLNRMCRRLIQAAAHYTSQRLVEVLRTMEYVPYNSLEAAKQALEECLGAAIDWAHPEETCNAYAFLSNLVKDLKNQQFPKTDGQINNSRKMPEPSNVLFNYAVSWRLQCEGALVRAAPRVVNTKAFQDLPSDLRKRLRELGCIIFVPHPMPQGSISQYNKRKNLPQKNVKCSLNTRSLNIDHVRAAFVPYSIKPAIPVAIRDLPKNIIDSREPRKAARTQQPPKVRMTKAQEQRAKFNMSKNITNTKPIKAIAPAVKSKYLEPRVRKENERTMHATNKTGLTKMMSSSESSRNSSPSQVRRYRMASKGKHQKCEMKTYAMSQDSLASTSRPRTAEPSTDSLSESHNNNRYATYTKVKRGAPKGSVESIQSARCHGVARDTESQVKTKKKTPGSSSQQVKVPAEATKRSANATTRISSTVTLNASAKTSCKYHDKTVTGSLMNATKSSSAKMVAKVVKSSSKYTKTDSVSLNTSRHDDVVVMNRSGTFLMDEPTLADRPARVD